MEIKKVPCRIEMTTNLSAIQSLTAGGSSVAAGRGSGVNAPSLFDKMVLENSLNSLRK